MPAAYDSFDYPSYWIGREYEHKAEVLAISAFLNKIKKIDTILEIGSGFGRLTPIYAIRGKKIILSDPSARLLYIAKKEFNQKKYSFIQSSLNNLPKKIRKRSIDLIILVRVLHHMDKIDDAIQIVSDLLKKGGYLILEFPNKIHLKATLLELIKGNMTVFLDIFPKDRRSTKSIRNKTLPFFNYHPEIINKILKDKNFEILEIKSVSNFRSSLFKRILPLELLLFLEKYFQIVFAKIYFGPSIFILAKKSL
jgi:ubiquinone/menaquinone biosynthesis C-methylase UbiE